MALGSNVPNEWTKLQYRSARDFLVNIQPVRSALGPMNIDDRLRNLRTNKLKSSKELWQASLFAHGIGSAFLDLEVYLAPVESSDFDCIARWGDEHAHSFAPIQIKEFVPEHVNKNADLQSEIDKLKKYAVSDDLTVAFYLNRRIRFEPESIDFSGFNLGELWFFGAANSDATKFMLWGDCLSRPRSYRFQYPTMTIEQKAASSNDQA